MNKTHLIYPFCVDLRHKFLQECLSLLRKGWAIGTEKGFLGLSMLQYTRKFETFNKRIDPKVQRP